MGKQDFLISVEEYANRRGPEDDIVLSSRVRLARNVVGYSFPPAAKMPEKNKVCSYILETFKEGKETIPLPKNERVSFSQMDRFSPVEREVLIERHLISRDHASRSGNGRGLVLTSGGTVSIMINEEDHLRMQTFMPGLQLKKCWETMDGIDTALMKKMAFAYDGKLGFLTACPTNLGTGLRVSAMLHLPALVITEQINPIVKAADKMKLAIRGIYGEGSEAWGNVFQASNQSTLGEAEVGIIERLEKVVQQLIHNERLARQKLVEEEGQIRLRNLVGRAYGSLRFSHLIDSQEAINLLSFIRLGIELGMFDHGDTRQAEQIALRTRKGHLQQSDAKNEDSLVRDTARASIIREWISELGEPHCAPVMRG